MHDCLDPSLMINPPSGFEFNNSIVSNLSEVFAGTIEHCVPGSIISLYRPQQLILVVRTSVGYETRLDETPVKPGTPRLMGFWSRGPRTSHTKFIFKIPFVSSLQYLHMVSRAVTVCY